MGNMGDTAGRRINKKHKFIADGIFYAELNALLTRELAEDGYSGVEVRTAPSKTQIIIKATRTKNVLGDRGRRIHELTAVVEKTFRRTCCKTCMLWCYEIYYG